MRCDEVMTREVEVLSFTDPVVDAARKMRELDVGFLPVVASDGAAVGTLTDRDIALRVVAEERSLETRVEEVMTAKVITCRPQDDLRRAEELMRANQVSRVVVLEDDGRIAGVISLADIALTEREGRTGEVLADVKAGLEPHVIPAG
jgi:CBS domain-containing protein